ncbi:ANTAR domain-containing protein [Nocardioides sp. AX2bis]|uniref:ANTAR domain-containing protein n=1 Tax=Nocardioides sp. AX2bis TaxID=2653157 RepID=UPI00135C75D4|nr:ANTAR domain-containing protein [Nocardioides sp. AX2bis]
MTLVPARGLDHDVAEVQVVAGSSGDLYRRAAEVELDLGEGPVTQALLGGHPVLVPEVGASDGWRWPAWEARVQNLGIGAVHAFPLQLGAARFGALSAFHGRPFALVPAVAGLGVALAALTTELLLDRAARTDRSGRPGGLPPLGDDLDLRIEVYQAQGMVMAALGVTMAEALARMRARAFATGKDLPAVAAEIVAGRLDLSGDGTR